MDHNESNEYPIDRPSGLFQTVSRQRIMEVLLSENILVGIHADHHGHTELITQTWGEYWKPVLNDLPDVIARKVKELRITHRQFIVSRFLHKFMARYCFDYFSLLESILQYIQGNHKLESYITVLHRVLGFECFSVTLAVGQSAISAGTSSIRNPCYLLAKIKCPRACDDPKNLALITTPERNTNSSIFYHYRQYQLDKELNISLFLYPCNNLLKRHESFSTIEFLTSGFSGKPDPRSQPRADNITNLTIAPFLSGLKSVEQKNNCELNILDVGGGTGILMSNICKRLLSKYSDLLADRKFCCTIVDLNLQNPVRYFRQGKIRRHLSFLGYEPMDYIEWLEKKVVVDGEVDFDFTLLCRLLNNASIFTIESTANWDLIKMLGERQLTRQQWEQGKFLPQNYLGKNLASNGSVFLTNGRVELDSKSSFRHLSLTQYYEGLRIVGQGRSQATNKVSEVHYPVRSFNPNALLFASGKSILDKLCTISKLTVIEDVDMTSEQLRIHLQKHDLKHIAASIIPQSKLHLAKLFCVCKVDLANLLPGERIW